METKEDLKNLDIVLPAKKIYDTLVESAEANIKSEITPDRVKVLRLVLGFQNSFINSFKSKISFFRLENLDEKLKIVKDRNNSLK